ncbi:Protein lunapark-B [Apis mellifera caucasica]|nr:Protein lunapark-B [Apis mellifera caucasica]
MPIDDEKAKCVKDKGNEQKSKEEMNVNIKTQFKDYDSFLPDHKGDIKVCMIGGSESLMYAALLLKQFRLIKQIHVVDTKNSLSNAILDINHIDTSTRIKCFKRKHLKQALKEINIIALMDEINPNINLNLTSQFEAVSPYVCEMAEQMAQFNSESLVAVFVRPVTATLPTVSEIYKLAGWWDPDRIIGSTALDRMRMEALTANLLDLNPAFLSVPLVGGADLNTIVPLLSCATPINRFTNAQQDMLLQSLRSADKEMANIELKSPTLSDGAAAAKLILALAGGLSGFKNITSSAYRKKTTIEILEDLDAKIKEIEKYGHSTEQKHKKIVGTLILYSVILYIITAFIFYFYFFPASLYDQIFYIIPLLIFPILILLTKKMVTWYYKRKISENEEKLSTMQLEKKKILDEVTETETYKKAKEILLKFAPDQLSPPTYKVPSRTETPQQSSSPHNIISPVSLSGELRRRVITSQNQPLNLQSGTPANTGLVPVGITPTQNPSNASFQSGIKPVNTPIRGYRIPLPRPILPRHRTHLDRLIDYIVGDGPSNRYALICRNCDSHNGMALKEEFEYFGFRCCYCNFWNPARKQKPSIPKPECNVGFSSPSSTTSEQLSNNANVEQIKLTRTESIPSDSDSDIEVVERPMEALEEAEHITELNKKSYDERNEPEKLETKEEQNYEESVEKMDFDESSS